MKAENIKPVWKSQFLSPLLSHMLMLGDKEEEKLMYLLESLEGAAENGRFVEGMYYCNLLLENESNQPNGRYPVHVKSRYFRLKSILHFQQT